MIYADPIFSNEQASDFEKQYFQNSDESEIQVIKKVGKKIAEDFSKEFPYVLKNSPKILTVIGGGHNGADALAFLCELLKNYSLDISILAPEKNKIRKNTLNILQEISDFKSVKIVSEFPSEECFDIAVEGIAGMSYHAPMREDMAEKINRLNSLDCRVKISIDIPAGLSDTSENAPKFSADITYATGIAKKCLFEQENKKYVGRIRYVDVDFFKQNKAKTRTYIVKPSAINVLKKLRPSNSDKRSFGKLFVISGSEKYAGAAMLNAKTAIRAGVGFVISCVPENLKASFCASEPSVIWHSCAVDEQGSLALENFTEINAQLQNSANALLCGSGLTTSRESIALLKEIIKANKSLTLVLDADAIQKEVLELLPTHNAPVVITPHEGEFLRIASDCSNEQLLATAKKYNCTILLKSNITRICDGEKIIFSTRGSPALARAGSGDILCALVASILANKNFSANNKNLPLTSAMLACDWLGRTAEVVSASYTENCLATSTLIDYLHKPISQ